MFENGVQVGFGHQIQFFRHGAAAADFFGPSFAAQQAQARIFTCRSDSSPETYSTRPLAAISRVIAA
jgi:hypothetical protein